MKSRFVLLKIGSSVAGGRPAQLGVGTHIHLGL